MSSEYSTSLTKSKPAQQNLLDIKWACIAKRFQAPHFVTSKLVGSVVTSPEPPVQNVLVT